MQGKLFWLVWLLVGCQLIWTAVRAFAAPWVWNPYQCLTLIFLLCLPVGVAWLGLVWQREGIGGFRTRMASLEAAMETPGSAIALRWNIAFWIVAGALVFAYFRMEQS